MLRNLSIRAKLLVLVVVPLLALLAAAAAVDVQRAQVASQARTAARFAATGDEGATLLLALQRERLLSVQLLAGSGAVTAADLTAARRRTDAADAALTDALAPAGLDAGTGATAAAAAAVAATPAQLQRVRAAVTRGDTTAADTLQRYSALADGWSALALAVADDSADRDVARLQAGAAHLAQQDEAASREQAAGLLVLSGLATPDVGQARSAAVAQQAVAAAAARSLLPGEVTASTDTLLDGDRAAAARTSVEQARTAFAAAGTGAPELDADAWLSASTTLVSSLSAATAVVTDDVARASSDAARRALTTAVVLAVASLLVLALAVLLATRVARDVSGRLRRVADAAARVRDDLPAAVQRATAADGPDPEPAPVADGSTDEVGRLATVVDDLAATALRTAREQAALRGSIAETFVNVARRDQTLLARQLSFLDQLERDETDPGTLEDLFTLDHLATRMRRNAESLLVLAGITTGRRLRRPLPLSDVIRTAAGEIEHYDRIDLSLRVDPPVVGHLALPVAHLVAELLENATRFSDPGSRVVVSTGEDARGVVVAIADSGLGMDAGEIEQAQQRIAGGQAGEFVGAQRLGFFVVGRLAGRLDVDVHFDSAEGEGTTVTLVLGPAHFTPGSVSAGQPELRALDAAPFAAPAPDAPGLPPEEPPGATGAPPEVPAAGPSSSPLPRRTPAPAAAVADPLAAAGLSDALSASLRETAAEAAAEADLEVVPVVVAAPAAPTRSARGSLLPSRRRKKAAAADAAAADAQTTATQATATPTTAARTTAAGPAQEATPEPEVVPGGEVAPVLPGLAELAGEAFTPVATADGGALMPRRTPAAPRSLAAAQDILPKAGRRPRHVRDSATPERSSAEAFWTARHRPTATQALRADGEPSTPFASRPDVVPVEAPGAAVPSAAEVPSAEVVAPAAEVAPVATPVAASVDATAEVPAAEVPADQTPAAPVPDAASASPFGRFPLAPPVEEPAPAGASPFGLAFPLAPPVEVPEDVPFEAPGETEQAPEPVAAPASPFARLAPSPLDEAPDREPAVEEPAVEEPAEPAAPVASPAVEPVRQRSAMAASRQRRAPADVRSMLSGFQAGVSRGRSGPGTAGAEPDASAEPGAEGARVGADRADD